MHVYILDERTRIALEELSFLSFLLCFGGKGALRWDLIDWIKKSRVVREKWDDRIQDGWELGCVLCISVS